MTTGVKTVSHQANLLLEEFAKPGDVCPKKYKDLEKMADQTSIFVKENLGAILQLDHIDQQSFVTALQERNKSLATIQITYEICWKAQVLPENYFKSTSDLRFLTRDERRNFHFVRQNPQQLKIRTDEHAVSNAISEITKAVEKLRNKMQENSPKSLPLSQTDSALTTAWGWVILC